MSSEMRDTLGSLAAMVLFFVGWIAAFVVAVHCYETDDAPHSGAHPDCPVYVAPGEDEQEGGLR